jgi:hypothetical protein
MRNVEWAWPFDGGPDRRVKPRVSRSFIRGACNHSAFRKLAAVGRRIRRASGCWASKEELNAKTALRGVCFSVRVSACHGWQSNRGARPARSNGYSPSERQEACSSREVSDYQIGLRSAEIRICREKAHCKTQRCLIGRRNTSARREGPADCRELRQHDHQRCLSPRHPEQPSDRPGRGHQRQSELRLCAVERLARRILNGLFGQRPCAYQLQSRRPGVGPALCARHTRPWRKALRQSWC